MYLKRDLLKKVGAFAIEAYLYGSDFEEGDGRCKQNSSVQLRPVIEHCNNKILLRFLTDEEKNEIELYKEDQIRKFVQFAFHFKTNPNCSNFSINSVRKAF